MNNANWHDLKGQVITSISQTDADNVAVRTTTFTLETYHAQECCESVGLVRTEGNPADLVGATIINAEEDSGAQDPDWYKESYDASHTWTKLSLITNKGDVHFWFLGESNGYYGETLSFTRL
jgi:hypothetical protein